MSGLVPPIEQGITAVRSSPAAHNELQRCFAPLSMTGWRHSPFTIPHLSFTIYYSLFRISLVPSPVFSTIPLGRVIMERRLGGVKRDREE
jgi:hypothetical protein